ncbi:MAG: ATP-binding cassette domain-containing protein [Thermoanaerobaculia bacterium]|nr:ATP-binding cassette domain-containing protein [Thermoanaerobaculia bacterium]
MQPTLSLRGLRKTFGKLVAVDDVSLDVNPGAVFGLLGPNGAGKTTTIRMLMDILGPDEGEVHLFGHLRTRDDLERVGYLPEERGLYRKMSVTDQLVFLAELHGLGKRESLPRIETWLDKVGLADRAKVKLEELSKGMQQKIQLVGTLLHEPDLVILDEPFSGLDPINQVLFKEVLDEYRAEGRTILFSTHVMEQAEKLCDHIALIANGRVALAGRLSELKRDFGGNSYRVRARGGLSGIGEIPGVVEATVRDDTARILLAPEATGDEILKRLVDHYAVTEFSSEEPSLEEIFVKAVHDAQ